MGRNTSSKKSSHVSCGGGGGAETRREKERSTEMKLREEDRKIERRERQEERGGAGPRVLLTTTGPQKTNSALDNRMQCEFPDVCACIGIPPPPPSLSQTRPGSLSSHLRLEPHLLEGGPLAEALGSRFDEEEAHPVRALPKMIHTTSIEERRGAHHGRGRVVRRRKQHTHHQEREGKSGWTDGVSLRV